MRHRTPRNRPQSMKLLSLLQMRVLSTSQTPTLLLSLMQTLTGLLIQVPLSK